MTKRVLFVLKFEMPKSILKVMEDTHKKEGYEDIGQFIVAGMLEKIARSCNIHVDLDWVPIEMTKDEFEQLNKEKNQDWGNKHGKKRNETSIAK